MKNGTTFVRIRSSDYLGDAKKKKKGWKRHLASSNLTFLRIAIDENDFRRMKEEGQIYKTLPQNFNFCLGPSYDLSKFSDDFTLFSRLWKTITKSLGKN